MQLFKSNKNKFNTTVFIGASALIWGLVALVLFDSESVAAHINGIQKWVVDTFGWFYVLSVASILVICIYLAFSRYGNIKLGLDHSQPKYTHTTWLAMLFSAGMGIGLMFYGVAEPVMHYLAPPNVEPETIAAKSEAMQMTFFHWGLHAWAIYAVVALILAYFAYRQRLPLTLRSALHPMLGDKIYTWRGDIVDAFAIISTVFGVATSLGLGAIQINAGFNYLFDVEETIAFQLTVMVFVILLAMASVVMGLDKGIKRLSQLNMSMAVMLLLFVLFLGPTLFLIQAYLQNIGEYLSDIVHNTFNLFAYQRTEWLGGWTILYWAWWLSWSPFVGMFIARISEGRTIREFIVGVLLIPSGFTFAWMSIFGNASFDFLADPANVALSEAVSSNIAHSLFAFLELLPGFEIIGVMALIMVVIFFVTSCDSGAMVVDMLASYGEHETPFWQRIYWTASIGLVSGTLLLFGGLSALQTLTIIAAFPFTIILLVSIYGTMRALQQDVTKSQTLEPTNQATLENVSGDWRSRLKSIVNLPSKQKVRLFIEYNVAEALDEVKMEMQSHGLSVAHERSPDMSKLQVVHPGSEDFVYRVRLNEQQQPDLQSEEAEDQDYYRAEVHLREGGQDYCIMQWSKEAIINDVIEQYYRHIKYIEQIS